MISHVRCRSEFPKSAGSYTSLLLGALVTLNDGVVVVLELADHPDAEAVAGVEALPLHKEVHHLRHALVIPNSR